VTNDDATLLIDSDDTDTDSSAENNSRSVNNIRFHNEAFE